MTEACDAADKAMDRAIEGSASAYNQEAGNEPGIVTDYLAIYAVKTFLADGDTGTSIGLTWPSDGHTSHYAALGLLDYARSRILRRIEELEED